MKSRIIKTFYKTKSTEYTCDESLFESTDNHVILSKEDEPFFKMISFGKGTFVKAQQPVYDALNVFFAKQNGIYCFDAPQLCEINEILKQYSYQLDEIFDTFLPFDVENTQINYDGSYRIAKLNFDDIERLEDKEQYQNALNLDNFIDKYQFAYAAFDQDKLAAISGTSGNSENFWPVGVDTVQQYRRLGLGTYLTGLMSKEVLKKGIYPIYSTWYSNIGSRTIAINCGYRPGCVEIGAVKFS